jgi:uncharacterized protein YfaP (DUF2135 family)
MNLPFFRFGIAFFLLFSFSAQAFEVQYMPFVREAVNPQIQAEIRVKNNENKDIPLSNLKIVYKYVKEGTSPLVGTVDQSSVVGFNYSSYRTINSDIYFEFTNQEIVIRFKPSAGILKDKDYVSVQFRVSKQDWSNHNQSNDPSFNGAITSLTTVSTISVTDASVANATVTGQIKTFNGAYLNNAMVKIGQVTKVTDAQGRFSMQVPLATQYAVSVSANGYASTHRIYKSSKSQVSVVEKLLPVDTTEIINPAVTNTVSTLDGASVTFPAMSGITENLSVSITSISAANREIATAPGNFSAIDKNGAAVELISQGMLDVVVRGVSTGNIYSLQNKGPFTVRIPASRPQKATSTQPLWFYDEALGKWKEEGLATLTNGVYVGSVTHFTTWNIDEPVCYTNQTCGCINGFVIDDSIRVAGKTYYYTITAESEGRSDVQTNVVLNGSADSSPNFTILNIPKVSTKVTVTNQTTGWSQTYSDIVQGPSPTACSNFDFLMVQTMIPITGSVEDACTNVSASNATVSLFNASGDLIQEVTTAVNGTYRFDAAQNTDYYVTVSKSGYKTVKYESINIATETSRSLAKILLMPDATGSVATSGTVIDALTGGAVANATLEVRAGINNYSGAVIATGTTNASGNFSFSLPVGGYTVTATAANMGTAYVDLYALACRQNQTQVALPPKQKDISVILRWGSSPADLDAHLTGPIAGGTSRYHVFYSQTEVVGEAKLDLDDTNGVGPETINIKKQIVDGNYVYSVHNYSAVNTTNSTALSASQATVDIYANGIHLHTLAVPTGQTGNLWKVFEMVNGTIFPVNAITNTTQPATIQ